MKAPYKIVFCGFGPLARTCLETLQTQGHTIAYVFSHSGDTALQPLLDQQKIPHSLANPNKDLSSAVQTVSGIAPDLLISINYRYILPKEIFSIPKDALNIHGALLPKYRGRTPHVWNIINGEKKTGVTCHIITDVVDAGDIIVQKEIPITDEDTGHTVLKKYEAIYPSILLESLAVLSSGKALRPQDEAAATFFGKRTPDMGYIDFHKNAQDIINFVRAQACPYPGAYYFLGNGKKMIIDRIARAAQQDIRELQDIGQIKYIAGKYVVRCLDAILEITDHRRTGAAS
jgi:methionyl-tRNA formyltransferase